MRSIGMALVAFLFAGEALAEDVSDALGMLRKEPAVTEVVEASLEYFRLNKDSIDSMYARSTWSFAVPKFEVSGGLTDSTVDDETINRQFDPDDVWIRRDVFGTANELRGKMSWDLPSLIFHANEMGVIGLGGKVEHIIKEMTRMYYARRKIQVDMILNPPKDDASKMSTQLRLEELTAQIDAMTGGWFRKHLRGRSSRAARVELDGE